ncbi:MAG: cellulose biosynthesis cyclic di-GMP-binding regulatory protein BcsB [Devosia sp.]|uniref:cellulose biosynthesis cyclic di-GMP-binding regulatory protein BcsB n=1 Tax=Devosia sp. TaxID=1871048 RepID=UPI00339949AE
MKRHALLTSVAILATLGPALAQPAPFDMSPESNRVVVPAPAEPDASVPAPVEAVAPVGFSRYLVPGASLRLIGEEAKQGVVVYLTAAQAAAPATLNFGLLNALVVAPEISNLRVRINQTEIAATPIASSSGTTPVSIEVPAGVLRAGANTIEFRATQRHRTDCTVDSTYQLWTEIAGSSAQLAFEGDDLGRISQLADIGAVGVDATGNTTLRLIAPDVADPTAQAAMLHLVQQIGLALRTPKLSVVLADAPSEERLPGVLDVAIMPAAELPPEMQAAQPQASAGPLAAMLPMPSGANTLIVSGPTWDTITRAGDAMLNAAPISPERPRFDLPNPLPLMEGGASASLASLGVDQLEFNGRRFTTQLQFELPADFYAYRYGELELVLDAAYSADVLPGSEIDIYTNGEIASATPLLRTDGGWLKDTRIRIPMTNLRPGRNEATLAVNLLTRSDAVCGPGWTGAAPARFILSNNSDLRLPDYARATGVPDLQVLTGTAWPYAGTAAVPLALGQDQDSLVAAMMFAARIATASGQVITFDVVPQDSLAPDANAVLVMPTTALSPLNLGRTGIGAAVATGQGSDDALLNQFGNNESEGPLSGISNWLQSTVGLDLTDLRLIPAPDLAYVPAPETLVVSQMRQPEGGVWTILTSTSGPALAAGTERLIDTPKWRSIAGRVSALAPGEDDITVVPANSVSVVTPATTSPFNLRRVAANWFSGNILYFALAIVAGAVLLMLITSRVLTKIGRPS